MKYMAAPLNMATRGPASRQAAITIEVSTTHQGHRQIHDEPVHHDIHPDLHRYLDEAATDAVEQPAQQNKETGESKPEEKSYQRSAAERPGKSIRRPAICCH
jgi:hypothetical protein